MQYLDDIQKVVVFGGGSFGTAMATLLARKLPDRDVVLLLRDTALVADINTIHRNTRYLPDHDLPHNLRATTDAEDAISGADLAVHAVPVQHSRRFLASISSLLPPHVPMVCLSKGLEVPSASTMAEMIPSALGRIQPAVFLSGPSFAKEVSHTPSPTPRHPHPITHTPSPTPHHPHPVTHTPSPTPEPEPEPEPL